MNNKQHKSQFLNQKKNGIVKALRYKFKLFWKELILSKAEKEAFKKKKEEVLWQPQVNKDDYDELYDAFSKCVIKDTDYAQFYSDIPKEGIDTSKIKKQQ